MARTRTRIRAADTPAAARPTRGPAASTLDLPPRLWSHQETADFLGLPPATLHYLNSRRTGPRSYKVGRHRRYDPRDVLAWLALRASEAR